MQSQPKKRKCSKCRKMFEGRSHRCSPCTSKLNKIIRQNKTYISYCCAKNRCNYKGNKNYPKYGGRGIEFKLNSWRDIVGAIGERPKGATLDRIDSNGHYEVGNIRWATVFEQAQNKLNNIFSVEDVLEIKKLHKRGMPVSKIAVKYGVPYCNVYYIIIRKGWSNINE